MNRISIFIICKNEERIINSCLKQASKLADEIIIVDSGSTDLTLNICQRYTDKIYHQDWLGFGKQKNIGEIFSDTYTQKPPSAAGECAAPKLLQYAVLHGLHPITIAEFWWGQSPKSEIRVHGQYYPACRGKCGPILAHMLEGIEVAENPMLQNPAEGKSLEIVYQDEYLLVINKLEIDLGQLRVDQLRGDLTQKFKSQFTVAFKEHLKNFHIS